MIPRGNLHTHSHFCDGQASPRVIAEAALALGMEYLGFSGHSYTAFDPSYCMSKETTRAYIQEVQALREEYLGRLPIYLGIEQDLFAETPDFAYDYVLGSVHYVERDGQFFDVDGSHADFAATVERHYAGDYFAYARDYYALVAELPQWTGCQIVAHLDLMSKFNEGNQLFDASDPRYLDAAFAAIGSLCREEVLFEINTGAISRGYRSTPYPEPALLKEIHRQGGRVIFGSDSHSPDTLLFGFEDAKELARSCGFRSMVGMGKSGFREFPL